MSQAVSRGQALEVSARVATQIDWDALDGASVQKQIISLTPAEFGKRFTAFLKNGGRLIIGEPKVIPIDRSTPFNPRSFIGEGWTIDEEDKNALKLKEVNLTKVSLEAMLEEGETYINGETKLKRLKKAGHIRLDAKVFQTLWENQELIPPSWKEKTNGNTTYIFFDGTILRDPRGRRCVLDFFWSGDRWDWYYDWLDYGWNANNPSAVLAS